MRTKKQKENPTPFRVGQTVLLKKHHLLGVVLEVSRKPIEIPQKEQKFFGEGKDRRYLLAYRKDGKIKVTAEYQRRLRCSKRVVMVCLKCAEQLKKGAELAVECTHKG